MGQAQPFSLSLPDKITGLPAYELMQCDLCAGAEGANPAPRTLIEE